ncbi:MAG: hypothetical protein K1X57_11740 [Gemmataceae bacterium]|nr:hypothetical protein [Gemmataceae bacterium]
MPVQIPDTLRPKLLALRAKQLQHPYPDMVLVAQEVVILTLGFGPAIYLGLDGRLLIWHYMDDEPLRVTEDIAEIAAGLVIGAKNYDLPELHDLLPPRPAGGAGCRACGGRRWVQFGRRVGGDGPSWLVCWECRGLGWQDAEPDAAADGGGM